MMESLPEIEEFRNQGIKEPTKQTSVAEIVGPSADPPRKSTLQIKSHAKVTSSTKVNLIVDQIGLDRSVHERKYKTRRFTSSE